jgi:hypothetical protein
VFWGHPHTQKLANVPQATSTATAANTRFAAETSVPRPAPGSEGGGHSIIHSRRCPRVLAFRRVTWENTAGPSVQFGIVGRDRVVPGVLKG